MLQTSCRLSPSYYDVWRQVIDLLLVSQIARVDPFYVEISVEYVIREVKK
jgi:hypothetical protein